MSMVAKKQPVEAKDSLPESVTLAAPYAYFEEDGETANYWSENQVVTDPDQIRDLMTRGARLVGHGDD